ncbi:AGAP012012-PA-like protein [Anopheles sinensis]|uniref:AGAP012012-PA-like protein n=1 Tax=Anopheles sinensis TaxID=74873 RepID=A0A084VKY1_ANOSI|nr:AGAP012012-PA-like protein [Anopheles sinensis]
MSNLCSCLSFPVQGEDSTVRVLNEPHVSVKIITEKKGLFLKHSEYEIKLKGAEKPVRRRYKDFVTLHGYLAEKYPYRLLPTLPPKQLMLDALLEERRRSLQTWLTIVSLHPVLGSTTIVGTFLRDATTDYQYRLRVAYEKQMDEYARLRPDVQLPGEDMDALTEARTRMRRVQDDICRLKQLFDDHTFRNEQQLSERTEIADILNNDSMRESFHDGTFEHMSTSMRLASRQCEHNVRVQQRVITERLHVLLEVLHAHSTLCERIERGIFAEHQKARLKLASTDVSTNSRTKTITATNNHGPLMMVKSMVDFGRIRKWLEEVNILFQTIYFSPLMVSLHPQTLPFLPAGRHSRSAGARGETELTERYLDSLPSILLSYAHQEQQHHQQMSKIWNRLIVSESSRVH